VLSRPSKSTDTALVEDRKKEKRKNSVGGGGGCLVVFLVRQQGGKKAVPTNALEKSSITEKDKKSGETKGAK